MQKEFMDQLSSMGKDASKPSLGMYNLVTKVLETLTRNNLDLMNQCLSNSVKQLQAVGTHRKLEDIVAAQTQLATETSAKMMSCAQHNLETLRQASNEFSKLIEESIHASVAAKEGVKKPTSEKGD